MPASANTSLYASTPLERETWRRLRPLLEDLLDEPNLGPLRLEPRRPDTGVDALIDARNRRWLIHFKSSSSPGTIAFATEVMNRPRRVDGIPLLVVPFMTPAGAKAAAKRRLNWLDMSGNAHIRDKDLYVLVQGHPNQFAPRGRPASAFAPKSSRVTRALLLEPDRWWRQKELAARTDLDASRVSRVVQRLEEDDLLARDGALRRPRDRDLLLDAWADEYRFGRHDVLVGHLSGGGIELARDLHDRLHATHVIHAFTGLAAAWMIDRFARFRLVSVYVEGDPRAAADALELRRNERGANVQLVGPNDRGVFDGVQDLDGLPCVSAIQVYLDLAHLPERAVEAAEHLRAEGAIWNASS